MVLDPTSKVLYIFAGQREERYLSDMYAYDIKMAVNDFKYLLTYYYVLNIQLQTPQLKRKL